MFLTIVVGLTVRETLATFQALYRDPHDMDTLIELCHLEGILNQQNNRISGGQKQRLLLALALINKPDLLFLDEPSIGLDPQARWDLWRIVETIRGEGKTIVLTTHYMEEAQYLCDEIAIMDHGNIIARGSPEALIKKYGGGGTIILNKRNFNVSLTKLPMPYRQVGNSVEIEVKDMNTCLEALLLLDVNLTDLVVRKPNMETVFLNLTSRQLRD